MLLPSFLPSQLTHYNASVSEQTLFDELCKIPSHLIVFFQYACDDETWSEQHGAFMQASIAWLTEQGLKERLSPESIKSVAQSIQKHYSILNSYIIRNVAIQTKDKELHVNSLLISACSEYLHGLFYAQSNGSLHFVLPLKTVTYDHIVQINEFACTGTVAGIWKHSPSELFSLLQQSELFRIQGLSEICQETLKRYIDRNNVLEVFLESHVKSRNTLKQCCCDFFNTNQSDVRLDALTSLPAHEKRTILRPLAFEFFNFSDEAIDLFNQLKQLITHLICGGSLTEEAGFSTVVKGCPQLISLDISRSRVFTERLMDIPQQLPQLDLSQCPWLTNANLKQMVTICPHIKKLNLTSNIQLTYVGWAELQKLHELIALDITRCHQIHDEDFMLILKACSHVSEFSLEECRRLTERSLHELARNLPQIAILNLARCHISDGVLSELATHCHQLRYLNLTRCREITNRGIVQFVLHAKMLEELVIYQCRISDEIIEQMEKLRPGLKVIQK